MKRISVLLILIALLTGCSRVKDIDYIAKEYKAEIITDRMDNIEILDIDKHESIIFEDPNTKEKTSIKNGVIIKTVMDVDAAQQYMSHCYIRFISTKGKDIRTGIQQATYESGDYVYLVYYKDDISDVDIDEAIRYLVIEDIDADKTYVIEVADQEGIMIYLK